MFAYKKNTGFLCFPVIFSSNFGIKLEIFDPQGRLGAVTVLGDVGRQFTVFRTQKCENWRWHPLVNI